MTITPDARELLRKKYGEKFILLKQSEVKVANAKGTLTCEIVTSIKIGRFPLPPKASIIHLPAPSCTPAPAPTNHGSTFCYYRFICLSAAAIIQTILFCLASVLVLSGCWNTIPQTEWLINNRHLFPSVLEAGSPRSGRQQRRVRALFLVMEV